MNEQFAAIVLLIIGSLILMMTGFFMALKMEPGDVCLILLAVVGLAVLFGQMKGDGQ